MASTLAPQRGAGVGVDTRGQILRRVLRNRKAVAGAILLAIIVLAAIFADYIAVHDPYTQNLRNRLQPPSGEHWLGTDQFGRDMFSRIVHGARISLRVGFISIGIALLAGGMMGLLAGYYGGWLETIFMRLVDIMLALPGFLLALAIVSTLGPSLTNVMVAVGIAYTPGFARVMRSAVLSVRQLDYVTAAQAAGASDLRIMVRHVVPNALNPLIVHATLALAGSILSAAGLSFLGMGAQPPTPEWGSMLNSARSFIRAAHHVVTYPGLAIMITVLCLNLLGDGLRDALDPRWNR
ncbi:MAG: glutathione ABC transporter permease GsiD [Firmicutes bacterium ZCTH02-B6]|nr:MAG: glutathione ABC transporter permease GsiD [Firmicutes bacterium ZCTH02-B6]